MTDGKPASRRRQLAYPLFLPCLFSARSGRLSFCVRPDAGLLGGGDLGGVRPVFHDLAKRLAGERQKIAERLGRRLVVIGRERRRGLHNLRRERV